MNFQAACSLIKENLEAFCSFVEGLQESEIYFLQELVDTTSERTQSTLTRIFGRYIKAAEHTSKQAALSLNVATKKRQAAVTRQNTAVSVQRTHQSPQTNSQLNSSSQSSGSLSSPDTVTTDNFRNAKKPGNQWRQKKQETVAEELAKPLTVTSAGNLAISLLEQRLGWRESNTLAELKEVHSIHDLKLLGIELEQRKSAYSILYAFHCLFVCEVIQKLSGKKKIAPQRLDKLVQSLNLKVELGSLVQWAQEGQYYKRWVDANANGYWTLLFIGEKNKNWVRDVKPVAFSIVWGLGVKQKFDDAITRVQAKYLNNVPGPSQSQRQFFICGGEISQSPRPSKEVSTAKRRRLQDNQDMSVRCSLTTQELALDWNPSLSADQQTSTSQRGLDVSSLHLLVEAAGEPAVQGDVDLRMLNTPSTPRPHSADNSRLETSSVTNVPTREGDVSNQQDFPTPEMCDRESPFSSYPVSRLFDMEDRENANFDYPELNLDDIIQLDNEEVTINLS